MKLQPLFVLGNPAMPTRRFSPLRQSEKEAASVGGLFDSAPLTGPDATEGAFKAQAAKATRLHLATHGVFDSNNPMHSYVVLARSMNEDVFLHAHEVLDLELPVGIVVLSACHTAEGKVVQGEGLLGLIWAFFVAGVPRSVGTLWQVESESTTAFMAVFYKSMRGAKTEKIAGMNAAPSIHRAQQNLIKQPPFAHPYYWAAFTLTGDFR